MGRPFRLAGFLLFMAVPAAAGASDAATELQEAAVSTLAVEVWSASNLRYMPGEPILLGLTFRNTGRHPVIIDMGHRGRTAIKVVFEGEKHKSIFLETCPGGLSAIYEATLSPGEAYHHSILLNEWLSFTQPGTYQLWILYDAKSGYTLEASNIMAACHFTVTMIRKWGGHLKNILERYSHIVMRGARNVGANEAQRRAATSAVCYSGADEALPLLKRMIDDRSGWGDAEGVELFKGIRRVGTIAAVELLSELMNSKDSTTAVMATVEVGLIEQASENLAVKAHAQELLKDVPEDFRFVEPCIVD